MTYRLSAVAQLEVTTYSKSKQRWKQSDTIIEMSCSTKHFWRKNRYQRWIN